MLECFSFIRELLFLAGYINTQGAFPEPLSTEDEARYLKLFIEKGDMEARGKLIEHNLRLVAHIAKKYAQPGRDQDDLISIGTIGLIKGVTTYSPLKGTSLATYASKCIDNEILMYMRSERKTKSDISLSEPIGTDKDGNEIVIGDILGSESDEIWNSVELGLWAELLRKLMDKVLTQRESDVITLRFGLNGGCTLPQREVGRLLGISRSYVSRIETAALTKLRNSLKYK
ncbi:MAG: RNA polymerase sporulation sigma factor SigK [Clostridia bacterium]|nr:RNA polymerase sporulation sigma factor SigK [Clostridia bacterium]